jgi:signal transduction histidine kinase
MSENVRYNGIMATDRVVDFLRSEQAKIARLWEEEVRRDQPLTGKSDPVLLDHLRVFLSGLADWIEGNIDDAEDGFRALVEGVALQRLGYGVGLETLTREYSKLRIVLWRELLALQRAEEVDSGSLLRLQEGMDRAINDAMHRYALRREEIRDRFITILGHDLRDPVSTVIILANMLASNPGIKAEHRVVASRITRSCHRMQRMVNDVLDFARGHLGGGIPALPSPNDMGEICQAAADEIIAGNPQRTITVETVGDLHGAFDRDRVHQALTNLIYNAIHHTDAAIEIRAYETDGGGTVCTDVTSHGAAIPEDLQRQLFDPFAHFDDASPKKGLGLGLYIVQQIALAHGGSCEVQSDEHATTFRIRWPRGRLVRRKAANE